MKKILTALSFVVAVASCNSGNTQNSSAVDSGGITNQSAIDTTKAPSGVDNSSVISTDTAAMNVQKSIEKGDSAKMKKH